MGLFVSSFFRKRNRNKKIIKISFITLISCVLLFIIIKVINFFALSYIIKLSLKNFNADSKYNITYEKKYKILQSKMLIKNLQIDTNTGSILVDNLSLKKTSGFILPSKIRVVYGDIVEKNNNLITEYTIKPENGHMELDILLEKHFFKKPTFAGVKIPDMNRIEIIKDKESRVALIDIEDCVFELKNNKSIIFIKQKGSITSWLEDDNLYIIKNGEPFKWNIEMAEVIKKEKWGINNENLEDVFYTEIKKMIFDYGYAIIDIHGKNVRDKQLRTSNMAVSIKNYSELIENTFNLLLQNSKLDVKIIKPVYTSLKNEIIPMLKKTSENSSKDTLYIKILKEEDGVANINGISFEDISNKFYYIK